jgi:hypothetical protein
MEWFLITTVKSFVTLAHGVIIQFKNMVLMGQNKLERMSLVGLYSPV